MTDWYYVEGRERVGPVDEESILSLIKKQAITEDSYLWKKGFENWKKLSDIPELINLLSQGPVEETPAPGPQETPSAVDDIPPIQTSGIDWNHLDRDDAIFTIKIGKDRGCEETEYGPYSLNQIKRAVDQNRVNAKTYVFANGMDNWMFLGDIPIYQEVFNSLPPTIEDTERRIHTRKPFVARMFFHDNQSLFEGICRDVSIGGMQILVANFPAKVGEEITLNVHPDNTEHHFVAKGKVVRTLDGGQGFSLRFINLAPEATSAINDYLSQV